MSRITGYVLKEAGDEDYLRQRERIISIMDGYPVLFRSEDFYEGEEKHQLYIDALSEDHKQGDLIIMDSITRISGSPANVVSFYMKCVSKGVQLKFINDGWLNTSATDIIEDKKALEKFLLVAIKEYYQGLESLEDNRHTLRMRKIEAAKARGVIYGCPKGVRRQSEKAKKAKEFIFRNSKTFEGKMSDKEIMEVMPIKINRATFYKYKSELKAAYNGQKNQ